LKMRLNVLAEEHARLCADGLHPAPHHFAHVGAGNPEGGSTMISPHALVLAHEAYRDGSHELLVFDPEEGLLLVTDRDLEGEGLVECEAPGSKRNGRIET